MKESMIFPREEKAEMLFGKILENLPAKQFTSALFDAYENKDLTAFLMAVCQNSMFDLLRNIIPVLPTMETFSMS